MSHKKIIKNFQHLIIKDNYKIIDFNVDINRPLLIQAIINKKIELSLFLIKSLSDILLVGLSSLTKPFKSSLSQKEMELIQEHWKQ